MAIWKQGRLQEGERKDKRKKKKILDFISHVSLVFLRDERRKSVDGIFIFFSFFVALLFILLYLVLFFFLSFTPALSEASWKEWGFKMEEAQGEKKNEGGF